MDRLTYTPFSGRLTPAQIHAASVQSRYYQNTRATTSRLAAEARSGYDTVRRAAYLRLVRRLGFEAAREVRRQERASRGLAYLAWKFRHECQRAAGVILAGVPR